jgi:hypothetical protein
MAPHPPSRHLPLDLNLPDIAPLARFNESKNLGTSLGVDLVLEECGSLDGGVASFEDARPV